MNESDFPRVLAGSISKQLSSDTNTKKSFEERKEYVLSETEYGKKIFDYYLGQVNRDTSRNFLSVFREETNPSANIFYVSSRTAWLYKDFGDGLCLDVFSFVKKMFDFKSRSEALLKIEKDLKFIRGLPNTFTPPKQRISLIEYQGECSYWQRYANKKDIDPILEKYEVKILYSFEVNGNTIYANYPHKPIFAFKIEDGYKIYQPRSEKFKHSWLNMPNDYNGIYGIKQLPDECETILIVEGLKDAIVANANLNKHNIYAIALDNAATRISEEVIEGLKSKTNNLLLCLDVDEVGRRSSRLISQTYNIKVVDLPSEFYESGYGKDISDFFQKNKNVSELLEIIQNVIDADFIPYEDIISDEIVVNNNSDNKKRCIDILLETQRDLQEKVKNDIAFPDAILFHNNLPVVFPNTINIIQGQTGVHKSRLAEVLCSVLLAKQFSNDLHLGFKKNEDVKLTICYIDTERNLSHQYPLALQRVIYNAGFKTEKRLPNFEFTSLVKITRKFRLEALTEYLDMLRSKHDNPIVIVLDIISDCIGDFNKTDESLELIDLLNIHINEFDVTYICLIHENPGGTKARGHIGTEITNKATTVIQAGYESIEDTDGISDSNLIRFKYLKCRYSKRYDPFYARFDEQLGGLVLTDKPERTKQRDVNFNQWIASVIKNVADGEIRNKDLTQILKDEFNVTSDKTVSMYLDRIKKLGILPNYSPNSKLVTQRRGKEIVHRLEEVT